MQGIALPRFGENIFQPQGAAGLDGAEAVLLADAVNGPVQVFPPTEAAVQHIRLLTGLSQPGYADTNQANRRLLLSQCLVQQLQSGIEDGIVGIAGLSQGMAAGDGGEVGISQLQGYSPGLLGLLAQLAAHPFAEIAECCLQ